MSYCPNCGKIVDEDSNFCKYCGFPLKEENDQQEFAGKVIKCPNCGEPLKPFMVKCPSCGYELRNVDSSDAIEEFSEKLEYIEAGRKPETNFDRIIGIFGMGRTNSTDEQILSLIKNFNVPNTKEDIIEFMILASSNIDVAVLTNSMSGAGITSVQEFKALKARSRAWLKKAEQVYVKAKLSFGSDPDFGEVQTIYNKIILSIKKGKKKYRIKKFLIFLPGIILVLWLIFYLVSGSIAHDHKEKALKETVKEIQTDLADENYKDALNKANTLYMDDDWDEDDTAYWNERRESLLKQIREEENRNN